MSLLAIAELNEPNLKLCRTFQNQRCAISSRGIVIH